MVGPRQGDTDAVGGKTAQPAALRAFSTALCAFQDFVHGQTVLSYRTDAADRLTWVSPGALRQLGYESAEALVGRKAGEALYHDPGQRQALLTALSSGVVPMCQEEFLRRADGSSLTVRTRAAPRAQGGMEAHCLVLTGEIEARISLAKALREMEIVFDNALVGMILSRNHRIEKVNARGAEVFGHPPSDLVGTDASFLFATPETYADFYRASTKDLRESGMHSGEYRMRRADGATIVVRSHGKSLSPEAPEEGVVWAFDDVSAQRRLEAELRASKQAAEAASVAKTQFLANISHELRTPLNGIMGLTQLMLDGVADDETQEYLGIIRQSASILMHIVGDLLDLSNVEAGRLMLVMREFDPQAELLPLLRNFSTQSMLRPFSFGYHFDPLLPARLIGDPNRIKQICINLIDNAFKYTKKGTVSVRIGLWENPGNEPPPDVAPERIRLHIAVSDTGVGIEPSRQSAIFEPFGIGEDYLTKKYSGAGLGLTVARRLAGMMGGDITVESEPGQGSTFYLTLECGLPEAGRKRDAGKKSVVPKIPAGAGLRILLAEDEPVNRIFTVRALTKLGHQVETAVDGREALALLGRAPFDLVLMDIQMPRLNGLDATRMIRSGQVPGLSASIPVVALTAYAMDSDRERGLEAGMDEYVTKPFEPQELVAAMERALRKE
ncbi:PAS/PAC sensor hybrid histidine kinase [Solidesulfovibrio fructosivorans JJ]]|uniref:histidine kinase n=1 Tax=Solidesulfovibrio fructosivorans JJ] TaxID=596151 RepID=E1JVF0_SOLFR|nr:PAS domain-containing hybrid sensor histidine kinase/response regulator [Solidesulfovibrio fructosivorans]EFL51744.1 PAS/PAC sensor hybrid histidine kinase [Solidesulfovibrio fructosivorans JJ]]